VYANSLARGALYIVTSAVAVSDGRPRGFPRFFVLFFVYTVRPSIVVLLVSPLAIRPPHKKVFRTREYGV